MKVLYIHQYFKTRDGYSSTRSYEFAKRFVESGHQVTMLTGDSRISNNEIPISSNLFSKKYKIDGIDVIAIKNNYSNYMGTFRRVLTFISFLIMASLIGVFLKKHDVIYATSTPLTIGVPAMFISKFKKTPFVFEVRDLWPEAPIQMGVIKNKILIKLLKKFERIVYNKANHIVTLSPGMSEGVMKENINKNKISMIPNSCDMDLFSNENVNSDKYIEKYNLENNFVAIHPGSMGVANGLFYVVEAAKHLEKMGNKKVKILLTGDGATKPKLEEYCKENNLFNVIFTGRVPKHDMPNLIAATDIAITSFLNIPILATNSPNKFFDSLAAGKPIIVNSDGWTKEIVEDNNIGYYVNPEKPEELANLLDNLSNDNIEKLMEKGEKSKKIAKEDFNRDVLYRELEDILLNQIK